MLRAKVAAWVAAVVGLSWALVLVFTAPASAHVGRTVGAYHFEVGWGTEPAYAGFENSVQLILSTTAGKPVTTLTDSLKVEVIFGSQTMQLPLEATFDPDTGEGTPGDYRAWFIPTAAGAYTFHFFGQVGKQKVDERFASGPTTFDEVSDPTRVQFPTKVPSGTEVAGRLDQEIPRLNAAIASAASDARSQAATARTLALVGVVLGAAGLIVAVVALAGRRRSGRGSTPSSETSTVRAPSTS
jgi:hypothetical protein